jgi:hypothetical protein
VNRAGHLISLLLLLLWLPATNHSLLEDLGWIHHDECSESSGNNTGGDHDAADGFCRLASSGVTVPKPGMVLGQFDFAAAKVSVQILPRVPCVAPHSLHGDGVSPPEMAARWQFDLRAALAARAPSFAS